MSEPFATSEAPYVCFTEFRKKQGEGWAVLHLTIRDTDDGRGDDRLQKIIDLKTSQGWEHCDTPKNQGFGGMRKGAPQKVAIPDDGRYEVRALVKAHFANKDNLRVLGVNGEECVSWEGRSMNEWLGKNQNLTPVQNAFADWSTWKNDEEHLVNFQKNKLIALCTKSAKSGAWYVSGFEIVPL